MARFIDDEQELEYFWYADFRLEDGTEDSREFPYWEDGDYSRECERQYAIECAILEAFPGIVWYSVGIGQR